MAYLTTLDAVIVAAALPRISNSLYITSEAAFWCGTGSLVAQATTPPLYGIVSESLGCEICILTALTIFLLASVVCALVQSITWLIAARKVSPQSFGLVVER